MRIDEINKHNDPTQTRKDTFLRIASKCHEDFDLVQGSIQVGIFRWHVQTNKFQCLYQYKNVFLQIEAEAKTALFNSQEEALDAFQEELRANGEFLEFCAWHQHELPKFFGSPAKKTE